LFNREHDHSQYTNNLMVFRDLFQIHGRILDTENSSKKSGDSF